MNEATLRSRIQRSLPISDIPALDSDALDELVEIAKRPDSSGRLPTDDDWVETYDLNSALHQGWLWKKAKAVQMVTISGDGTTFDRDQFIQHCDSMLKEFKTTKAGSLKMQPTRLKALSDKWFSDLPTP